LSKDKLASGYVVVWSVSGLILTICQLIILAGHKSFGKNLCSCRKANHRAMLQMILLADINLDTNMNCEAGLSVNEINGELSQHQKETPLYA
jgi:hypothetical protein